LSRGERFSGARVLVIEDEPHVRAFIARVLRLEGATVVTASTGAEGLARVREDGPFHLVTLDLCLPDVSGWDVLDGIRTLHPTQDDCRVVVLSASADTENPAQAAARNAAFVRKPVGARELVAAISPFLHEGFGPQA
jgi:two-component system KDP operon response regulator KdpE